MEQQAETAKEARKWLLEQEAETAEVYLKLQLAAMKDTGCKDPNSLNGAIARNVLQEELGTLAIKRRPPPVYHLDEDARDRLLAHARQDAAHALCNTVTLLNQMKVLRRAMLILIGLFILGSAAVAFSLH
jgi:hypothetical protein